MNLWKQKLVHVPDSVWEQDELETLVLAENELNEVSEKIGRLTTLRMLDPGHNRDGLAERTGGTRVPGVPVKGGTLRASRCFC